MLVGAAAAAAVSPSVRGLLQSGNSATLAAKQQALSLVPKGVPVAAAPDLVPHLSHRRAIYQLPEPFFARHGNGEYWTDGELARRSGSVAYVVIDLDSLDPFPREQTSRLPALLTRRGGFVQVSDETSGFSSGLKRVRKEGDRRSAPRLTSAGC